MISFLAVHSADEHRMIYSFSNTTSYSTFYASFSSFRITLWPMWLANDSLVFIHHSHTNKKTHRTDKKNWQTWWENCAVPESIQFNISCSFFFTQLNCSVYLRVYGALYAQHRLTGASNSELNIMENCKNCKVCRWYVWLPSVSGESCLKDYVPLFVFDRHLTHLQTNLQWW